MVFIKGYVSSFTENIENSSSHREIGERDKWREKREEIGGERSVC